MNIYQFDNSIKDNSIFKYNFDYSLSMHKFVRSNYKLLSNSLIFILEFIESDNKFMSFSLPEELNKKLVNLVCCSL